MDKVNQGFKEFAKLQQELKKLRQMGLYRGNLNIKKREAQAIVDRNRMRLRGLNKEQKKLFENQYDVFRNLSRKEIQDKQIFRKERIKAQRKAINDLKDQYQDMVKQTGITGNREFFKEQKPSNSEKHNKQTISDLRNAILPLLNQYNAVKKAGFSDMEIQNVKEKLRELRNEKKIKVDLRQSHQELKKILSKYIADTSSPSQNAVDYCGACGRK
jgi:hypothetical protein